MAKADSVPSPIQASITGASAKASTKRVLPVERYFVDQANTGRMPVWSLGYATAVLLLGWFPWNALLILLLVICRHKRSRFRAFDAVPSQEPMRSLVSYKSGSSL
jgi:hypothetical protein